MTSTHSTPTVALIGIGYWGKNLARNFHALGALKTICDPDQEKLTTYKKLYPDVKMVTSYEEVLSDQSISAVAIAAPAIQHAELTQEALMADKDVFVEKPIALDADVAAHLQSLAEQKELTLMVGHLLHYHPAFRKLCELVKKGRLGKLFSITSHRMSTGPVRNEENALWNFSPHDISMLLSLCNNRLPEKVACFGGCHVNPGVEDTTITTLVFPDQIKAHVHASWLHPYKEHKLSVVGSEGMVVFDDTQPWQKKLSLTLNYLKDRQIVPREPESVQLEEGEPLKEECRHFLDCCLNRKTPLTDGQEGTRVTRVLVAAQQSLDKNGAPVTLQSTLHKV